MAFYHLDQIENNLLRLKDLYGEREYNAIVRTLWLDFLQVPKNYKLSDLSEKNILDLQFAIEQLLDLRPIQYITSKAWFYGFPFYVNENVLIPRPETEELVELSLKIIQKYQFQIALDIGCGSGIIPVTIKKKLPKVKLYATDISSDVLKVSRKNAEELAVDVIFIKDNILQPDLTKFPDFDLIISNPPYITREEMALMSLSTIQNEPHLALFANNPSQFYHAIFKFAKEKLKKTGIILLECNEFHIEEISTLAKDYSFSATIIHKDLQGKQRILQVLR